MITFFPSFSLSEPQKAENGTTEEKHPHLIQPPLHLQLLPPQPHATSTCSLKWARMVQSPCHCRSGLMITNRPWKHRNDYFPKQTHCCRTHHRRRRGRRREFTFMAIIMVEVVVTNRRSTGDRDGLVMVPFGGCTMAIEWHKGALREGGFAHRA